MAKRINGHRVSHTKPKLCELDDNTITLWMAKAREFLHKQGWTWEEFDEAKLLYGTAVYLYEIDYLLKQRMTFPCYVVHCQDDDSRFETPSHSVAFTRFKQLLREGKRAGMFHWKDRMFCERLQASDDYAFSKDYGARRD